MVNTGLIKLILPRLLKHFQQKWEPVLRSEVRKSKELERFHGFSLMETL
jgi:hypothetical protein